MTEPATVEASTGKRLKGCEDGAADRISNLPEEIISFILSLMPTKSAAATSFLSKRWMLRKIKFTVFDFDDSIWPEKGKHDPEISFVEFVNMVLLKHGAESIRKFTLVWHIREFQPAYLKIWVDTLIARNVRVLDLDIETDNIDTVERYEFTLPTALFSCGTLEVLIVGRRFFIRLPPVVCLPKLTILELFSAKFESDEAFQKLILGCPKLHSLYIERTHFDDSAKVYDICSPTLKSFQIAFYYCDCFEDLESDELKVKIDAPALESLTLGSDVEVGFSIVDPKSVKEVELNLESQDVGGIVEFVQEFVCSESLNLAPGTMTLLSCAPNQLSASFERLTNLCVHFTAAQWGCLLNVIDCCINLEALVLTKESSREKSWTGRIIIPRCFSSSLRHVSFSGFNGLEDEMCMLNLILQQGLLLETVTLRSGDSSPISCDQKLQIQNNVLQFSRASPVCKISFSWVGRVRGCPRISEIL